MSEVLVNRIYNVEVNGVKDAQKQITAFNNTITQLDAAFVAAKQQLQQKIDLGVNDAEVQKLTATINSLQAQLQSLSKQRDATTKEAAQQAKAEQAAATAVQGHTDALKQNVTWTEFAKERMGAYMKDLGSHGAAMKKIGEEWQAYKASGQQAAKVTEDNTKATKDNLSAAEAQAKAELDAINAVKESTKYTTLLSREKDRARKASADQAKAIENETGSYYDLLRIQKQTSDAYRATSPTNPEFDSIKQKAIEAKAAVDSFNRSLSPDGTLVGEYKTGILNAFKSLGLSDVLKQQKNDINNQLGQVIQKTKDLAVAYKQAQSSGDQAFARIDTELRQNIEHQQQLESNLKNINQTLGETNTIGYQVTHGISEGFKNLKNDIAQVVIGYVGFQAILSGTQSLIHQNAELSDSIGQLQIYLKGSKDDAQNLVDSLKKLDTRTSLANLVDISTIVAKKGVAKEEIAGVTKALDQLFVVLGKEVGDPHEAIASMVKLVNVYSEDKHITADNIGNIGAAIQKLTSSGVATGGFLINFAERMAGVRGITGITIQNVLGLGAALEELGQRNESAGTAAQKLVMDMFLKPAQYAKAAGESVAQFSKELSSSPIEALIKVAAALKKPGEASEELVKTFDELGVHGARVIGVLGDITGNSEYMRKRVSDATNAFGDQGSILAANAIKQNTFAATLDKISKQFELLGANTAFQTVLLAIASTISFVLSNLTPLIAAVGVYSTVWAIANAEMIKTKIVTLASNVAIEAQYAWLVISQTATKAYAVTIEFLTGVTKGAAAATTLLGAAMELLPLGIILTALAILAASFKVFGSAVAGTTDELRKHAIQIKIDNEIRDKANASIADQIAKMQGLVAVVTSSKTSFDTSKSALEELIKSNTRFSSALQGNVINLNEVKLAMEDVRKQIILNANAQAASSLSGEKYKDYLQAVSLRQKVESAIGRAGNNTVGLSTQFGGESKISDTESDILKSLPNTSYNRFLTGGGAVSIKSQDFSKVINQLKQKETESLGLYEEYQKKASELQAEVFKNQANNKSTDNAVTGGVVGIDELKKQLESINAQISAIDKIANKTTDQEKQLKDLRKQRAEVIRQIKELGGSVKENTGASRISGQETDQFRTVDSGRDIALANREKDFLELKKNNAATYAEEVKYNNDIKNINLDAITQKLAILDRKGKLNADELLKQADFRKQRVDLELKTQEQLEALNKKEFDKQQKGADQNVKDQTRVATSGFDTVNDDPSKTTSQKLAARQALNYQLLAIETNYLHQIEDLRTQYGVKTGEIEEKIADDIKKLLRSIKDARAQELEDEIKDVQTSGDKKIALAKVVFDNQKESILNSPKSNKDKNAALTELDKQENISVLSNEVDTMQKQIPLLKEQYDKKQITEKQYADFYEQYVNKIKSLQDAITDSQDNFTTLQGAITSKLRDLFQFDKGSGNEQLLGNVITDSFNTAQNALSTYFDVEKQQVENSLKLTERRIDADKRVALGHAQSAAEQDTIDRQFAAQKLAAEKEAFDKNKKMQIAQAEINLATQLSNLAVIAFSPGPLNIATLGVAGTVMYAVQAALALVNFGLNVSRINAAQFAGGGRAGQNSPIVNVGNGKINAVPNIPAQSNGDNILATVKTGEVVLNDQQQKALGGPATFAAIGVPGFASGGITGLGDFRLGENLKAPWNPASFINGNSISNLSASINTIMEQVAENNRQMEANNETIHRRIDNIKVQVVAREVETTNNNMKKASAIGTL